MHADEETQKKLIAACNLLCEHVQNKLPDGWTITLTMDSEESSLTLTNPDGDDVESHHDHDVSGVDGMCVTAIEAEEAEQSPTQCSWCRKDSGKIVWENLVKQFCSKDCANEYLESEGFGHRV